MTYRLTEMHPLDALYQACRKYPGGVEALAGRLGMRNPMVLYSKLRQQVDTHHVNFDGELSEIIFCLRDANVPGWDNVLHAFLWRHGFLAVEVPTTTVDDDAMTSAICASVQEHAEAISAIGKSLKDGKVTSKELDSIDKEIEEAMTALAQLRLLAKKRAE